MFEFRNISVSYQTGNPVIENFSLSMKEGEIVGIVGESGSGKTTLIHSAMGLLSCGGKVTNGKLTFFGDSILDYSDEQWRNIRGKKIAMIYQDSGAMLNPIRKIGSQYVEFIRTHEKISKKEAWNKSMQLLEDMMLSDVDHVMNSYPFQLSGGMRQRVGIAMAMTFSPNLLLADEPTSALDVTTQAQIVRQMKDLREIYHTAIIIVTHNIGLASYIADRIVVMKSGKIVETGTPEERENQSRKHTP
ncbi:peptide ABC transporter ATP-binding protein, partial [Lachnotalea glycerini]